MSAPLRCRVDDRLTLRMDTKERARFDALLREFQGQDGLELTLKKARTKRSVDQLRYWFGVPIARICGVTGYTKMQQHYLCLAICFGVILDPVTGHEVLIVPASRRLTVKQFSDLMEWVIPWAFETFNGLQIPAPNEVDLDELPGGGYDDES